MKYEDGSTYWVKLFSYFTEEYIDGCRTSYTVMTDVTELVKTKNEQEMLMQAMKVSVSRHLVDKHFTVVEANDFYYELIGYTREEYEAAFHNHCDEYFKTNEGSWEKIHSRIEEMYAAGKTSYELFVPLKLPDGSTNWVKMTGFFTDEYQDGMQLAYTTMVDVTELMQISRKRPSRMTISRALRQAPYPKRQNSYDRRQRWHYGTFSTWIWIIWSPLTYMPLWSQRAGRSSRRTIRVSEKANLLRDAAHEGSE